jgi:zinc transporter, ZIP family
VDALAQGVVASFVAGMATGIGGLPVLLGRHVAHRVFDGLLGFSAGIMVALSAGALLVEIQLAAVSTVVAATVGGAVVLVLRAVSLRRRPGFAAPAARGVRIAAIVTAHNVVEGLAVVATFGDLGASIGVAVAVAIAIHNVPEGLAVAVPLRAAGIPARLAAGIALASGLGEPLGALAAVAALVLFGAAMPAGAAAAAAAGAMTVLAATELIPEAFSHGFEAEASGGLLVGVIVALGVVAVAA